MTGSGRVMMYCDRRLIAAAHSVIGSFGCGACMRWLRNSVMPEGSIAGGLNHAVK
jgi:hypothetical protein